MGKKCIIGVDAAKLAGLQIDMLQKLRNGQMTIEQLEWFNHLSLKEREQCMLQVVGGPKIFPVTVDYTKSLDEMIKAGGYDWKNEDITAERFPVKGEGTAERKLVLVHLGRDATTDEALAEMKRRGLKPAGIEDLLAFGAEYPDEQRKLLIIVLASSWVDADGRRGFPDLDEDAGLREFDLRWNWDGLRWRGDCRFLALCE